MPRADRTFTTADVFRIANNNLETGERIRLITLLCGEPALVEQDPTNLIEIILRNARNPLQIIRELIDVFR